MDTRVCALGLGVVAAVLGGPLTALAGSEKPLLVVVEGAPDGDDDPAEIRRAIAAEAHLAAVPPGAAESEVAERALLIAVERNRIAVALRDRTAAPVVRVIPAPADHGARVRAIAWLAGNLVRDQVSGIVTAANPATSGLADMPAIAPPAGGQPPIETPPPPPNTEPPPYRSTTATLVAGSTPAVPERPRWILSLEAGPLVGVGNRANLLPLAVATLWRAELRHVSEDRRFFLGVSAEGTSSDGAWRDAYQPEVLGAAGLCGWSRRRGAWAIEGAVGLGVDIAERQAVPSTMSSSTSTGGFVSTTTVSTGLAGGIFGTAGAALSHTLGDAATLFLRLGAHISPVDTSDWFASSTIGVSYGVW